MAKIEGKYKTVRSCRLCGSTKIKLFLDLGMTPLAGDYLKKKDIGKEKYYPLRLYWCNKCSYVGIMDIIPQEVFFTDYRYLSSVSLKDHFQKYAIEMTRRFKLNENKLILEIGSNDGVLLEPLKKLGVKVIGVDPAKNIAKVAIEKGLDTIIDFFDEESAGKIMRKIGKVDAVFANNVLAHMDNMDSIMRGIKKILKRGGILVFEVHYLIDLLKKIQFDFFYQEHFSYYTLISIEKLLNKYNLKIFDVKKTNIHSGSVRIYAEFRESNKYKLTHRGKNLLKKEKELLNERNIISNFSKKVDDEKNKLRVLLEKLKKENKTIVGYGAAGRGNTLLNVSGIDSSALDYIVDESPERYGRYTPGSNIPIVSPEVFHSKYPDFALLLAWNYKKTIFKKENEFIKKGGKFILPLPHVKIYQK